MIGYTNSSSSSSSAQFNPSIINMTWTPGATCSITNGINTLTAPNTNGNYQFKVPDGIWKIICTKDTYSRSKFISLPRGIVQDVTISAANSIPEFTYTGDYDLIETTNDWKIKFLTSGTLIFTNLNEETSQIDVFLVGGGGGAPGSGGGGGYTTTQKNILIEQNTEYTITIGAGGAGNNDTGDAARGGTTSAFNFSAAGGYGGQGGSGRGKGGNGGSGGGGWANTNGGRDGGNGGSDKYAGGTGQGSTTREFGEPTGDLYAGGGCSRTGQAWDGGGTPEHHDGYPNTGGGAGYGNSRGGTGVVVIRNTRN